MKTIEDVKNFCIKARDDIQWRMKAKAGLDDINDAFHKGGIQVLNQLIEELEQQAGRL